MSRQCADHGAETPSWHPLSQSSEAIWLGTSSQSWHVAQHFSIPTFMFRYLDNNMAIWVNHTSIALQSDGLQHLDPALSPVWNQPHRQRNPELAYINLCCRCAYSNMSMGVARLDCKIMCTLPTPTHHVVWELLKQTDLEINTLRVASAMVTISPRRAVQALCHIKPAAYSGSNSWVVYIMLLYPIMSDVSTPMGLTLAYAFSKHLLWDSMGSSHMVQTHLVSNSYVSEVWGLVLRLSVLQLWPV